MLIDTVNYYDWRDAPIEMCVDEEMATTILETLKVEVMEVVGDGDFRKAGALIRSIDVLTAQMDKLAEVKAEKEQETNDWVYCSKRVPTHDNDVLVAVRESDSETATFTAIDRYDTTEWYNFGTNVIAWRELPEPAEPEDDTDA